MAFNLTLFDGDQQTECWIDDYAQLSCDCDLEVELAAEELGFTSMVANVWRLWQFEPEALCVYLATPFDLLEFAKESVERLLPLITAQWPEAERSAKAAVDFAEAVLLSPQNVKAYDRDRFDRPVCYGSGLFARQYSVGIRKSISQVAGQLTSLAHFLFEWERSGLAIERRSAGETVDDALRHKVIKFARCCYGTYLVAGEPGDAVQERWWRINRLLELALTDLSGKPCPKWFFDFNYVLPRGGIARDEAKQAGLKEFYCEGVLRWR